MLDFVSAKRRRELATTPAPRLKILYVSQMPASPPQFGAQARMHGIVTQLAKSHDVTAVILVDDEFDIEECRRAMQSYCRKVVLMPNPYGRDGTAKRLLQLRSLVSFRSFQRLRVDVDAFQRKIDELLSSERFDVVNVEFFDLGHLDFRKAPPGERAPVVIVDSHEIAYDLARQFAARETGLMRRLYAGANWRKLRREELAAYASADGVYLCSTDDEQRLADVLPAVPTAVIPNAADVDYFRPRPTDPAADGRTLVYFGLLSTVPNEDGVLHFAREIWPRILERHPAARFRIIGKSPPASIKALASDSIEVVGFVEDLRPYLASAAAIVVPLRLGGGTRLKIVEAMAMGKAIVSTRLGAEGIDAIPGQHILIADEADAFADAASRLLDEPQLAVQLGGEARKLAVERYAWARAASDLETFYNRILERNR